MGIKVDDVVKFSDEATPVAAIWCRQHDITGLVSEQFKIGGKGADLWRVDTVLKYPIWVQGDHLIVVTNLKDSPAPDDVGT
jgi:hypothetical protein